jgi:hypothetical protein
MDPFGVPSETPFGRVSGGMWSPHVMCTTTSTVYTVHLVVRVVR